MCGARYESAKLAACARARKVRAIGARIAPSVAAKPSHAGKIFIFAKFDAMLLRGSSE
jgi:hypothetical protein